MRSPPISGSSRSGSRARGSIRKGVVMRRNDTRSGCSVRLVVTAGRQLLAGVTETSNGMKSLIVAFFCSFSSWSVPFCVGPLCAREDSNLRPAD
jgi:hypothetical protein